MIRVNNSYEGQCLEEKIRIAENDKQPIEMISPMVFTERKDGVRPETDIRTDRWEIGREAANIIAESYIAKRKSFMKQNEQSSVISSGGESTAQPQNS